jgi:NADPH-dependent glutamate synthase beta subunit-like oxidoreductase
MNNTDQIERKPATSASWIADEVRRCLSCFDPPCQRACPASIPIPEFIRAMGTGNLRYASKIIRNANPLASICGEVCPEEVFCQSRCTRGSIDSPLLIRELHSFATKSENRIEKTTKTKPEVAIIGGGPAGISCAIEMAKQDVPSVIFENKTQLGGVPRNSIPKFRLTDKVIDSDIKYVRELGIETKLSTLISNPRELLNDYKAVLLATGLPECARLNIPGEDNNNVMSAIQFLEEARGGKLGMLGGKKILVVGGGNVSLDVSSVAAEHGASDVKLIYRRGPAEMKVWESERREAAQRGVVIEYLTSPQEFIIEKNQLTGIRCLKTQLNDKLDLSGRRTVSEIPGSDFIINIDLAIIAIGMYSVQFENIKLNKDYTTSIKGIFSAGDLARGEGTIVEAVADGKAVATKILDYIGRKG